ncbi:DUF2254 family protein [Sulfurovum sp.]|uniref:DUF2254 family protein n=1 Tax=Sulfurovum sp. TaxID=1969726 RepID=UPI0038D4C535
MRQIVDMALKALSPGVNDTTTAVMCVDYLTEILTRLACRQFPPSHRYESDFPGQYIGADNPCAGSCEAP